MVADRLPVVAAFATFFTIARRATSRMPYRFIWESPNSIWTKFTGFITFDDTIEATNALYADRRSERIECAFWDFSDIDGFEVGKADVEEMASMDCTASHYMKPMKAAFIVRDAALMELTEQYIAFMREFGSPWQNQAFSSMDDAREWAASVR